MTNQPISEDEPELMTAPASKRQYTRRAGRETGTREPTRDASRSGGVVVTGRSGEVLTRKRKGVADPFHIPAEMVPEGWEYQWCAVTVAGNAEVVLDMNLGFAENGWRSVPADRYPGRFMPPRSTGSIIRGGQMLMERPKALSDEA